MGFKMVLMLKLCQVRRGTKDYSMNIRNTYWPKTSIPQYISNCWSLYVAMCYAGFNNMSLLQLLGCITNKDVVTEKARNQS